MAFRATLTALVVRLGQPSTRQVIPARGLADLVGIAGDLVLHVPVGSRERRRVSLLGDRQIQVAADDGPEIQLEVDGCSAM
jgi:hypothetical protein